MCLFDFLIGLTGMGAVIDITSIIIGSLNESTYSKLTRDSNIYRTMIVDSIKIM